MTTPEALNALADRVEREEPSRHLNQAIWFAVRHPGEPDYAWNEYTTSLDAAVTLVPEGFHWDMDTSGLEVASSVFDTKGRFLASADVEKHGRASTPAAALTAAALRARAEQARAVGAPQKDAE